MESLPPLASFIVRITVVDGEPSITLQNIRTRQLRELSSWHELMQVLQEPFSLETGTSEQSKSKKGTP